ncbi:hypothetical protein EVC28_059 [Rhizobium phage RHph_I1_23]|nr:hypothetical protein EVC28_059 [Rhizobium phage RHph_I1_23]
MAYDQAVNAYNATTGLTGGLAAGAGARSYPVDQIAPPPPVSAITDAHRTFEEARILANRVKEIVGRIVGYVPEDPNKCGLASDAIFDNLKSSSVDTRQAINEAMDALARLERQLP